MAEPCIRAWSVNGVAMAQRPVCEDGRHAYAAYHGYCVNCGADGWTARSVERRSACSQRCPVGEPSKSRRRTTIICEPDYRPGTRDECPNALHDHPLPDGYIAASDVAAARLRRGWANPRCPDCGLYGWRRGRPLGEPYEPAAVSRGGTS